MAKTKILVCCSELGAGTRGSSMGPGALRTACINQNYPLFNEFPVEEVHLPPLYVYNPTFKEAKYISEIADLHAELCAKTKAALSDNARLLIFSGDHSNAAGIFSGFREASPGGKLGLIWIDAHGDLHSPYTSPSGNMHGMPVAALLGLDNKHLSALKNLPPEVVDKWNEIKRTGAHAIEPKIRPEDLTFIDIRDLEAQEWQTIKDNNIRCYAPDIIRKKTLPAIIDEVKQAYADYDGIYISFDVDCLDVEISRGTGTPVPGGFSEEEATLLLQSLIEMPNFRCLEITEINPLLDTRNAMAETIAKILRKVL